MNNNNTKNHTNRGRLPGFYYDAEKNKYFQIQAAHNLPTGVAYTTAQTERRGREQREKQRRRRVEEEKRKQTVQHAAALRHPLLVAAGLQRELGRCRSAQHYRSQQDALIVGALEHSRLPVAAMARGLHDSVFDVLQHVSGAGRTVVGVTGTPGPQSLIYSTRTPAPGEQDHPMSEPCGHAQDGGEDVRELFRSCDRTIFLECATAGSIPYIVACTDGERPQGTTVYVAPLDVRGDGGNLIQRDLKLRGSLTPVWDCKLHPQTHRLAMAAAHEVRIVDVASGDMSSSSSAIHPTSIGTSRRGSYANRSAILDESEESFACAWLQPNVLAYGMQREERQSRSQSQSRRTLRTATTIAHMVKLWDIRIESSGRNGREGQQARIQQRQRIVGLEKLDQSETHLLISTNHHMQIYDLRMLSPTSPAQLSLAHTSAGGKLNCAIRGNVIAAVDADDRIRMYSLATGEWLRTLCVEDGAADGREAAGGGGGGWGREVGRRPGKLRWQEDGLGSPYLQTCTGDAVHRWAWHEGSEGSEERKRKGKGR